MPTFDDFNTGNKSAFHKEALPTYDRKKKMCMQHHNKRSAMEKHNLTFLLSLSRISGIGLLSTPVLHGSIRSTYYIYAFSK